MVVVVGFFWCFLCKTQINSSQKDADIYWANPHDMITFGSRPVPIPGPSPLWVWECPRRF